MKTYLNSLKLPATEVPKTNLNHLSFAVALVAVRVQLVAVAEQKLLSEQQHWEN